MHQWTGNPEAVTLLNGIGDCEDYVVDSSSYDKSDWHEYPEANFVDGSSKDV